jgi:hypothetical protein
MEPLLEFSRRRSLPDFTKVIGFCPWPIVNIKANRIIGGSWPAIPHEAGSTYGLLTQPVSF